MPINILMPALSPTMTEGNLARWLKKEGDQVKAGDVLAEIETDKATMEVEAVDEGTLARILVPGGAQGVKVNDVIAILVEEGEDAGAVKAPVASPPLNLPPKGEVQNGGPAKSPSSLLQGGGRDGGMQAPKAGGRIVATPLARRVAEQQGIDLATVSGSGPNGRIVRADLEGAPKGAAKPAPATAKVAAAATAPVISSAAQFGEPAFDLVPHTSMRKTIARRLQESKQFVPHFYLTIDCEIDKLLKLREEVNAASPKEGPAAYKVSVNDFVIKASALALVQVPTANASWSDDGIKMYKSADVSVAVAIPGGLITPILRNAERKRITELSAEIKELAGRAKQGKLKPEEYTGGSFSVSNLGMFGIKDFSAVINPPQACILAVGAGEERAVVRKGQLAVANVMTCTLSVDHRAVDGAIGAEFLAAFKRLIEQPLGMLV
ncbi:pyruvate dehydrogenase complex dihydrolipoamide acetyltransferase [Dongia sp.]|uniref:pyruvate dehydrogenase complex dihydrolipoamide acetyltransferase n=1 Tax=Dongia sp. TaxID=1977262 RepID=UPI0035AFD5FA